MSHQVVSHRFELVRPRQKIYQPRAYSFLGGGHDQPSADFGDIAEAAAVRNQHGSSSGPGLQNNY